MTSPDTPTDAALPSLLIPKQHAARTPVQPPEALRMLSGLDSKREAPAPNAATRWRWGAGGLVMVLASAAAVGLWQATRSPEARLSAPSTALGNAPVATPMPMGPARLPASSPAPTSAPALIERSIPVPTAAPGPEATRAPAATRATVSVNGRQGGVGAVQPPGANPRAVVQAAQNLQPPRAAATTNAAAPVVARASVGASNRSIPAVGKMPAGQGPDSDVELLEAMVAHIQGLERAAQSPAVPASSARAQSIARLVQECKQLGPEETRACRAQICAGYWGKAEACPTELAPPKGTLPVKPR